MYGVERIDGAPRSAVVVGAGIVGLSTAWFLQEHGVEVTVVDRTGIGAGASWGNAGWVSPTLTIPLNDPALLRYGIRSLFNPAAPLHIPLTSGPRLLAFLGRFAMNCRQSTWTRVAKANVPLNQECLEVYDVLTSNGVAVPTTDGPITALFETTRQAEHLMTELRRMAAIGQTVTVTSLSGDRLRDHVPLASSAITAGISVEGQRFVDPGRFVHALGDAVIARGAELVIGEVTDVRAVGANVNVDLADRSLRAETAVIATGAWLSKLAKPWVRTPVQAGRGYSFTVPVDRPLLGPIYLPDARVACTPYHGGLRVAGTMEFRSPDDPLQPPRVDAIIASAAPLLDGVDWDARTDVWVGPRPVSSDGRPLIGEVAQGIYVAGGHGMWGLAHGPVTGRLLAEYMTTGKQPEALREFDPRR
ncbi:NAD(P)/FAD-dependent oxidoreductase [Mycolicibacterium lutetiense]|uniref:D-amino-acid dehydrogenase n=1 Tax=Mycolicibacterium lutetiense TaxID=1641992 RepID=A0ABS5A1E5_9MYCO|nr:FAD-binding oxidoreductase [Mycolicibacterium lutetiense]MBP2455598.1 D-amino-acid dehydrogenase [Mycolicibacterium lutetiense]